jgi:hypothetical protein
MALRHSVMQLMCCSLGDSGKSVVLACSELLRRILKQFASENVWVAKEFGWLQLVCWELKLKIGAV